MPLKVLLCSPPVFDFYYSFHRSEPLGLLYIKAMLKQYTWLDVDIYDARLKAKSKKLQTPDVFQYLHHIYIHDTSWFSLFYGYKRFGASFDRIAGLINEKKYDVVCISSLFTAYHHDVELLVKKIKEHSSAIVIVGGWAVWSMPTDEKRYADVYVKGDGEVVLPELLHDIYTAHNGCFHKLP
ncbi:MAG TPA: cobalamin B12-binding domain-containing protein, partial [Spirochaetota bacterium]|nr:cobalamin B12-binding domain-containing protein [Spirochaetota bacterium]